MKWLLASALLVGCDSNDALLEPTGATHQFIVSRESMARGPGESDVLEGGGYQMPLARTLGYELGSYGFDPAGSTDVAFAQGDILELFELQMPDESQLVEDAIEYRGYAGANPQPAPCAPPDPSCGLHLTGDGHFDVAAERDSLIGPVASPIEMTSGSAVVHVEVFDVPLELTLLGASVFLDARDAHTLKGRIVGGVDAVGFRQLATAWLPKLMAIVDRDCQGAPPDCGCVNMGEHDGHSWLKWFDATPKDCKLTVDEIIAGPYVDFLTPEDATVDGVPVRRFGVFFEAVPATFAR